MLTPEPRKINRFWACSLIFFKHISFWCLFLNPHLPSYHSNIGVQILAMFNLGTPTLCKMVSKNAYSRVKHEKSEQENTEGADERRVEPEVLATPPQSQARNLSSYTELQFFWDWSRERRVQIHETMAQYTPFGTGGTCEPSIKSRWWSGRRWLIFSAWWKFWCNLGNCQQPVDRRRVDRQRRPPSTKRQKKYSTGAMMGSMGQDNFDSPASQPPHQKPAPSSWTSRTDPTWKNPSSPFPIPAAQPIVSWC